jgi:hypothetical protein
LRTVAVEEAFKTLKGDLAIRPVCHHRERRVEAHIFAYDAAALLAVHQDIRQAAESVRVLCGKALDTGRTVSVVDLRSAGAKNKIQHKQWVTCNTRMAASPSRTEFRR